MVPLKTVLPNKKHWYVILTPIEEWLLQIAERTKIEIANLRKDVTRQEGQPSDEVYLISECPKEDLLDSIVGAAVVVDVTRIVKEVGGL